tara:strand:+ start:4538 stop:5434 length:897 start_codon:yes stop_codon:yes gene_type:complete
MVTTNNEDYIKIRIENFKNKLKYNERTENIIPEYINKKYEDLILNYDCFKIKYDAKSIWEKKKTRIRDANISSNINKIYVISTNFSEKEESKKKIIGLLNKLTIKNNEQITENIKTLINNLNDDTLNDINYDIVWQYIQNNPEKDSNNILNLYINILYLFDNKNINITLHNYVINKDWVPNEYYINNDMFKNELYDDYCKYIKWKGCQINKIKAWEIIINKTNDNKEFLLNIKLLIYNIFNNINSNDIRKHILDYYLDLLYILLRIDYDKEIIDKLKNIINNIKDSSTKFKILNIIEL